jgi:lactate dehydrogenase-like 2-hydroxyacid dehydrogenase
MRILVTRRLPDAGIETLQAAGHAVDVSPHDRPLTPAELLALSAGADGLLTMLNDRVDEAFLAARPSVKAVANYAVGFNNIDVAACTARGVGVTNTPGVLTDATAEVAWTLLMMAARRAGESERFVRANGGGGWKGWEPLQYLGTDVVGRRLGIIGAGRIGARVARMAAGFDMEVVYHNRKANPEMDKLGARLVGLDELLKTSDFVSVHVPLTPETKHLLGPREFGLMKPTAVLVNTARGPVVDEAALAAALRAKQLFAAGLDVYEAEPTIHPALYDLENVVLLPHIGSATVSTRTKMAVMAAENLIAMLAGRRPANPVNDVWGK